MTEPGRRPAFHRSVFARLVAVMVVMAALLLALVSAFYFAVIIPGIHASLDGLMGPHVRAIAELRPDLATARRIGGHLDMGIRYEGPDTSWSTDPNLPTIAEIAARRTDWRTHLFVPRRTYYLAPVGSGRYVFSRRVGEDLGHAHALMLALLLALMAAVILTAWLVMRRALRPLRLLEAGVTRLSEGQMDVVVPRQSDDEFGMLTDAFNRMAERVRDMLRAREQLLRDVSHELRSPLTRMKVALEMLPDGGEKRSMASDVAEMEAMVTTLLDLERLRDGGGLRREPLDLVRLVHDVAARYADGSPGVRVVAAPGHLSAEVDADAMRTVLRNVIENAIKFSLPDSAAVEIGLEARGDRVEIRVTDDGPGLPPGDPERLFEPFHRPDPSRSRRTGGYGLGLGICRRIMEAHGGTIEALRRPGRGAALVMRLPLVR